MKNKAFTLIELLAVIIILGVLLLITIPSVTSFIKESKEQTYVTTLNNFIKAARELVDTDKISMNDKNTTYYIPKSCLKVDKESESPFGKWEDVYVAVTYDGTNHKYFVSAKDETEHGVELCPEVELNIRKLRSDLGKLDSYALAGNTKNIYRINVDCVTSKTISEDDILDEKNNFDAVFIKGETLNQRMKQLSNSTGYRNTTIKHIKRSLDEPGEENKQTANLVSASNSPMPIYMWFDDTDGTIYWWSEDRKPSLNKDSYYTFYGLEKLEYFEDIKYLDTSKVEIMRDMFAYSNKLKSLDLSTFDTSNVTNMTRMFYCCDALKDINLSGFDTSKVIYMSYMFSYTAVESLDLSSFDTSNVLYFDCMFSMARYLSSVDISDTFVTSKAIDISGMFNCTGFETLDLRFMDTSNVTDMSGLFWYSQKLKTVDLSSFNTSKVTDMSSMFGVTSLTSFDFSNFDTSHVTDMSSMFYECEKLITLDLTKLVTDNVENMSGMFSWCKNLESINLSGFNTSNCTNFYGMFNSCYALKTLDVTMFDTSKATTMGGMFAGCRSLTSLDITNFVTSNVTTFGSTFNSDTQYSGSGMFEGCSKLTSLDLTNFDTSKATSMGAMFDGCSSLTYLNLSSFDTSKVINMGDMFNSCKSLTTIDISNFDFSKVRYVTRMFMFCDNLETIIVGDKFTTSNITNHSSVFYNSKKLVGGKGTTWDANYTSGLTYFRVDNAPDNPGLFTLKTV